MHQTHLQPLAGAPAIVASAGHARDDLAWTVGETLAWGWGARATPVATVDPWLATYAAELGVRS